ncbi:MAG: hypothetical protein P8M63_07260, partial [Paracoccaceae bacterium]|nr:hypothetical protein [Paracoccaceae bacterium]
GLGKGFFTAEIPVVGDHVENERFWNTYEWRLCGTKQTLGFFRQMAAFAKVPAQRKAALAGSRPSLRMRSLISAYEEAGVRQHTTLSTAANGRNEPNKLIFCITAKVRFRRFVTKERYMANLGDQ